MAWLVSYSSIDICTFIGRKDVHMACTRTALKWTASPVHSEKKKNDTGFRIDVELGGGGVCFQCMQVVGQSNGTVGKQ
jgi:hypothetical protein